MRAVLWWREHASTAPDAALRRAREWLSETSSEPELRVLARHIACLASVERGRMRDARHHARSGLGVARRAGLPAREAQLRLSLAWIELDGGDCDASWKQLLTAEPHLSGADLPKAACLRGLLHCQGDRYAEAVDQLSAALRSLRAAGDRHWEANALLGRGLARHYRNEVDAAEADLFAAERIFASDGRVARSAACQHNRGCVAFKAGDLARALRLFTDALTTGLDPDANPEVRVDRAEALAAAGMHADAREEMRLAAAQLVERGRAVRLAETRLALAGCALRDGDPESAIEEARLARRLFRSQGRPAWSALAAVTAWQAKLRAGDRSRHALSAARRAAHVCADYGWTAAAADLWLTAGRAAREMGLGRTAHGLLTLAAGSQDDEVASAPQRAVGALARALLAQQAGDRDAVFDACGQGLRTVETYAAAMAAYELRVQAFGLSEEISATAIGTALETGAPREVLRWSERSRASALSRRMLEAPSDGPLREALVELRAAVAETRDSHSGYPNTALARVAELEERVRQRAVLVDGATSVAAGRQGLDEVCAELGDAVLVSYLSHAGELHCVSIVDGHVRLSPLGRESDVAPLVDRLRRLLARQTGGASTRAEQEFAERVPEVAGALEEQLLAPVASALAQGRPLVVVPTGRLHALPWAALPACRGRSVTVAPSLRCWLRSIADARRDARADRAVDRGRVWVAGPGLDHAESEVAALHETSGGQLLVRGDATTERVLHAADGANMVHIAAHGWFRQDQPLLSCLDLADGPLYGYDLDGLRRGPSTVVLSACEVGRSAVSRGDELSGLAAALLGRGTATVIASVVPVPDERTAEVMVTLHSALQRGVPPAEALADAQRAHGESGFICFGHGGSADRACR